MATRFAAPRSPKGSRPRLIPTRCRCSFATPSTGSTLTSTTGCAPPTRSTKSSCSRCSRDQRQGQHRIQGVRRPLLRRLRALLHREGIAAAGQHMPDPQHSGRTDQGEQLFPQDRSVPRRGDRENQARRILIRPERYKNEALNMLAEPLSDLCISRPKARMDWGIELPFDDKYVTYVWYDAILGLRQRAAATGSGSSLCPRLVAAHRTLHRQGHPQNPRGLLAGDAAGGRVAAFSHLNVHGWLNFGGSRMSKSSGNVRDPVSYEKAFGPDVLRYLRDARSGLRTRRRFLRRAPDRSLQRRPRQRPRQL